MCFQKVDIRKVLMIEKIVNVKLKNKREKFLKILNHLIEKI